jgi:hypothetical protein
VGWLGGVLVAGVRSMSALAGALTTLVGGSVLAVVLAAAGLEAPWIAVAALAAFLIIVVAGAYHLWSAPYDAAFRFAPTWEHLQTRADTLRVLAEEHSERGEGFRRQYMAGHVAATRRDYDRAVAAGYPPDFDRARIGRLDLADVDELFTAFEDVVERWRAAERTAAGQR